MNNREAHFYLEELQRMMTQHRGIFSEEFVCANGMAIQALEQERKEGAVEVVRCKDCRHWVGEYFYQEYGKNYKKCEVTPFLRTEESHFCAMGERRESNADAEGKG